MRRETQRTERKNLRALRHEAPNLDRPTTLRLDTVKTNPCFRYEGKTGEELNLVIFKDNHMNNRINEELSTRPFH